MGSPSTVRYLEIVKEPIRQLARRYKVQLKVVGATAPAEWNLEAVCSRFELASEIHDLQSFDIGIMPLADEEWSEGKCAFKALQYMGVGIPAVCSPVGVVREIIHDGQNGMLATSEEEWFGKLETLITCPDLRGEIGRRGRKYVTKNYSIETALPRLVLVLHKVAAKRGAVQQTKLVGSA